MGEAPSPSKLSFSTVFSPSIWAVIFAFAAFASSKWAPLDTARPNAEGAGHEPPPPTVDEIGANFARHWEDPLGAAYAGQRSRPPKRPAESTVWADLLSRLGFPVCDITLRGHFDRLHQDHHPLMVMPVLVPGEPYAETRELRMRTRYAVLAALGRCGYDLSLPSRMSYVTIPVRTWLAVVAGEVHTDILVPVKLYKYNPPQTSCESSASPRPICDFVLVCWINESQLGDRPLDAMRQILEGLFCRRLREQITLRILGPSSSGMLKTMLEEDAKTKWNDRSKYQFKGTSAVYSPRATICSELLPNRQTQFSNCGLTLVRTIGSDDRLVQALRLELTLRNAWPQGTDDRKHVLLIFERDTAYGRGICETTRKLEAEAGRVRVGRAGLVYSNLHTYTYLRGIDGILPGDRGDEKKEPDSEKQRDERVASGERRPEGRSQYDYLRRLEEQIARRQEELYRTNRGEITTIGVVGSDFYDKLLVLRALRASFPRVCFFTTDVEAGYCHPREFEYTRNLVVASHFGLELNRGLQRGVPPFRESYQTADFFAVLTAIQPQLVTNACPGIDLGDPWGLNAKGTQEATPLEPLVFEIGRNGPYQLPPSEKARGSGKSPGSESADSAGGSIHPCGSRDNRSLRLGLLVLSAAFLIGCIAIYDHHTRWAWRYLTSPFGRSWYRDPLWRPLSATIVLVLTAVLIGVTVYDDRRGGGEPFDLSEGISAWPSVLLRYVVAVLCAVFLVWGTLRLKNALDQLCKDFLGEASGNLKRPRSPLWFGRRRMTFARVWKDVRRLLWGKWRSDFGVSVGDVFVQYRSVEEPARRWTRVGIATATYLLFASLLFWATNAWPNNPYRGDVARAFGRIVLMVSAVGLSATAFLVLDAAEFCRLFVRRLASTNGPWPSKGLRNCRDKMEMTTGKRLGYRDEGLKEFLTIRVIAQRTRTVSWLIYGPCVFLFLMFLARHPWLDNWRYPWPLLLIYLLILAAAVIEAGLLRSEAGKARNTVLQRLRDRLLATPPAEEGRAGRLKLIIERIEREQEGAFRPLTSDPLLNALAVPVGGISIVAILEQLTRSFGS